MLLKLFPVRGKTLKKTIIIYGIYGIFSILLLAMGQMMDLNVREYALIILPILLILSIIPLAVDVVGAVCLVIAWLPFSRGVAQFELGVITLNPYIVGMVALSLLASWRFVLAGVKYDFNRVDLLVILISLIYFLSTIMSSDVIGSGYLAFHAIFVPVISYFVCRCFLLTEDDINKAVVFFIISVIIFSIIAITQFVSTGERVALLGMPFIGVATLTTTGLILIIGTRQWKKTLWFVAACIVLLGVVVSFSRMYLVVLLIAPWMFGLIKKGSAKTIMIFVLATTLLGTLLISINPEPFKPAHFDRSLEKSFERITSIDFWKGSIYGRALSYHTGLEKFVDSPLIGYGLQKGEVNITVHNFPVEWLEYSGLIGYILWISLFYQHYKKLNYSARDNKYIATGLLTIIVILLNSVTNGLMHGIMPTVTFIILGINEAMFLVRNRCLNTSSANSTTDGPSENILRRAKA